MRSCFGNYMHYPICKGHSDCDDSGRCSGKTNIDRGKCNCKCKASCHIWRQNLQAKFTTSESLKKSKCPFYMYLDEYYNEDGTLKVSSNKGVDDEV